MKRRVIVALLLLCTPGASAQENLVRGPQWFRDSLIYFNDFETAPETPLINSEKLTTTKSAWKTADGLFGQGLQTDAAPKLELKGEALSPHRPLTVSFWWCLPRDMTETTGFGLFALSGKGIINAFAAGKGPWCALQKPAGVAQVYYFPGIQNVNGIYDFDLMKSLDLSAGVWHHSAAVLRRASVFQFYTDGKLVSEIACSGREWSPADEIRTITFGQGVVFDDVAILNRAIDADFIADYIQGVRQLHGYHAPEP